MATNPAYSPYHTQRFSFIGSPQQRDATYNKDQRFLNMYPELIKSPMTDGKKYYLKKRPGTQVLFAFGNAQGRGVYFFQGAWYSAVGSVVYQNQTVLINLGTTTGPVGFCEFRTDSVDGLFICDGTQAWFLTTGGTLTPITDPNFPTPHIPSPVFLDGYIFIAGKNSQTIHNSTLTNPTTWPSDGFIDAEMYPDNIVWLTKSQNYLIAVGSESCEFMYDNANATGSPLQRNAPAVSQLGCPAPTTVAQTEKETILVGTTNSGGRTIWIIEGFTPTEIANEPVREALDLEGSAIANAYGFTIQSAGHKWYVLNLSQNQRTFVYDFEEKMWHEWTNGTTQSVFPYNYSTDSVDGAPVLQNGTSGTLVEFSPNYGTDMGQPINCQVVTVKLDFDTIERKRYYRLSLVADSPNGTANTPITVDWSDDDYNTWVGNKTLQINASYPTITQLGYARRRAFRFTYQQPYPLRMESFEVDIIQEVRR